MYASQSYAIAPTKAVHLARVTSRGCRSAWILLRRCNKSRIVAWENEPILRPSTTRDENHPEMYCRNRDSSAPNAASRCQAHFAMSLDRAPRQPLDWLFWGNTTENDQHVMLISHEYPGFKWQIP